MSLFSTNTFEFGNLPLENKALYNFNNFNIVNFLQFLTMGPLVRQDSSDVNLRESDRF